MTDMTDNMENNSNVQAAGKTENNLAMWCHLSTFAGIIIPFGNFIAPLILWLTKREEFPLVDDQGKESLNFQISIFIYAIISAILSIIVIGIVLLIVVSIFALIQVIRAAISASNGQKYRYALSLRIIK